MEKIWLLTIHMNQTGKAKKRKIVLDDSDEETADVDAEAYHKGLSAYQPSPAPKSTFSIAYMRMRANGEQRAAKKLAHPHLFLMMTTARKMKR